MSWQAVKWAVDQRVGGPTEKAVLMVIAEAANADGSCWPSHATIADKAELGERTVWGAIQRLEAKGKLRRTRRHSASGARTSDLITLLMGGQTARDASRSTKPQPQELPLGDANLTAAHLRPNRGTRQNPTAGAAEEPVDSEPVEEPGVSPLPPERGELVPLPMVEESQERAFERFWSAYPPRWRDLNGKPKVKAKFAAVVRQRLATAGELVAAAERYAQTRTVRDGFAMAPLRWLTEQHWTDEHAPEAGRTQQQGVLAAIMAVRRDS